MPRLVLQSTTARVCLMAPRTRAPTEMEGSPITLALALALAAKSATVMACPGAKTWTFPGLSASSSARQDSR